MKRIEVSRRLDAVTSLVEPGNRFADVGTDHGLVPICLVQRGICPGGLAMDVRSGPLQRAQANIRAAGLAEQIEVRLGDGFSSMRPGEAQTGILAGMGGPLMIRILETGKKQAVSLDELILSPQSEIAKVRAYIREQNFRIVREVMVKEDGKYYTVMKVLTDGPGEAAEVGFAEAEDRYGRFLLHHKDAVLWDFLTDEEKKLSQIAGHLHAGAKEGGRLARRLKEIERSAGQIKAIKEHYYEMQ